MREKTVSEIGGEIFGHENMEARHRYTRALEQVSPLGSRERGAVTFLYPKIAAILYKRVWAGVTIWDPDVPFEVLFADRGEPTERPMDIVVASLWVNMIEGRTPAQEIARQPELYESMFSKSVARLEKEAGTRVGRLYATKKGFETAFEEGEVAILHAALSQMPLIDESKLDWKQVLEIRKDKASQKKIRKFLSWADLNLVGMKPDEISETLEERMDNYHQDLKHLGITTLLTTAEFLLPSLSDAVMDLAGLEFVLAGQTILKLSKQAVNYRSSLRKLQRDPPIAFFSTVQSSRGWRRWLRPWL